MSESADPLTVSAISCTGLERRFGDHVAVAGVDLEVVPGEVFGLLGPNGAGKTTTIRMLVTLLPPGAGTIRVFGRDARREKSAVRRMLGYVPQQLSIEPALTGWENVMLFARLYDVPRADRHRRVGDVLEAMGLSAANDRLAGTFSGGMVRRLELAQALVNRPRLLVLDEPTVGLDPVARGEVWAHIAELRAATRMTVLVTTHYMEEAQDVCDRVALMNAGVIRAVGPPASLRADLGDSATLEDVFRHHTGANLEGETKGSFRAVRTSRTTANRVR